MSNRERENIALHVLVVIGESYYAKQAPLTTDDLVDKLMCARQPIEQSLNCFEVAGIIRRLDTAPQSYLPAVPLENLTVAEAYSSIRNCYAVALSTAVLESNNVVDAVMQRIENSIEGELGKLTIKELVMQQTELAAHGDPDTPTVTALR